MAEAIMNMLISTFFGIAVNLEFMFVKCMPACEKGQFYDIITKMCDYCYTICDHAELTDTGLKCLKNCPDYFTSTPASLGVSSATAHINQTTNINLSHTSNVVEIVAIVIATMVAIIFFTAVLVFCKRLKKPKQNLQVAEEEMNFPVQEEGGNTGDAEVATGRGQNDRMTTTSISIVEDCCL